jgi:surface antigen
MTSQLFLAPDPLIPRRSHTAALGNTVQWIETIEVIGDVIAYQQYDDGSQSTRTTGSTRIPGLERPRAPARPKAQVGVYQGQWVSPLLVPGPS